MSEIPPFDQLQHWLATQTSAEVEQALTTTRPSVADLAALLSPAADAFLEAMACRSASLTQQRFGRTIQLYAPLYVSNYCTNRCAYCGFSADHKIDRRVLTLGEAEEEADLLLSRGINHVLLVSGEAKRMMGVAFLEKLVGRLRDKFAAISIEVQPLGAEEYARLFKAGVTAVAVYQETYDRRVYRQVHLAGKKRDYDHRFTCPERAAAAGMREVGIGALLGLADWRTEGLALGMHLALLRKKFWQTAFTVSFPRLRPARDEFEPPAPTTERDLSHLIFALRIFDPDVGLIVSTREEPRFRDGMIGLGPTRYSAGSCTVPGGYAHPELSGEQFAIGDHRSPTDVYAMIRDKGFDPVRKDWDSIFQQPNSACFSIHSQPHA